MSKTDNTTESAQATLYRMVMEGHICPFGLTSKALLEREGLVVDDRWLTTREQTDAFKARHDVDTTPQTLTTTCWPSARWPTAISIPSPKPGPVS